MERHRRGLVRAGNTAAATIDADPLNARQGGITVLKRVMLIIGLAASAIACGPSSTPNPTLAPIPTLAPSAGESASPSLEASPSMEASPSAS
jgi:hypothetical protein